MLEVPKGFQCVVVDFDRKYFSRPDADIDDDDVVRALNGSVYGHAEDTLQCWS